MLKKQHHINNKPSAGFTLVELSVVIVITSLIAAGVTAGKSLIDSGKIQAQAAELQNYNAAFNTFLLQYNAVAGDMKNASSLWPGANDGDGNGKISCDDDQAGGCMENRTMFEHLSRAKLISGNYDSSWAIGVGYPRTKIDSKKGMIAGGHFISGGGFETPYQLTTAETAAIYTALLYMCVGQPDAADSGYNDGLGIMTPTQAQALDIKIDDGKARQGLFKGFTPNSTTVGNCLTGAGGDYLISNTKASCFGEYVLKK